MKIFYNCCLGILLFAGCGVSSVDENLFEKGEALGVNKNENLEEASGLAASVMYPDHLWTHNDSGNPAKIFLLNQKGHTQKTFRLAKIDNRDWEDIAIGPGPEENISYLYIGDIGDNLGRYPFKYIYRTKEPAPDQDDTITQFDTLIVKLDDGMRDTETLMSDPVSKNLYLVSKREDSVRLYEIAYPFESDTLVAKNVGKLPIESVNGGSISTDGKEVLIRNYQHIYYWHKADHESIPELLKTAPIELPYDREPQGESIAWALDGSGYFTLSENAKGERSKLFFYKRK